MVYRFSGGFTFTVLLSYNVLRSLGLQFKQFEREIKKKKKEKASAQMEFAI